VAREERQTAAVTSVKCKRRDGLQTKWPVNVAGIGKWE